MGHWAHRPYPSEELPVRTPSIAVLFTLALLMAACGAPAASSEPAIANPSVTPVGDASPQESSASAAALVYTSEQLCGLLLTESDVPPEAAPNPETADAKESCLRGFRPDDDPFPGIISGAYLFADAAEARGEAEGFVDDVTADADPPYTPFAPEGSGSELGDAAYCFLRQYEESPTAVTYAAVGCYWVVGNVVLSVTYNGDEPVEEADALRLAEIMHRRAQES